MGNQELYSRVGMQRRCLPRKAHGPLHDPYRIHISPDIDAIHSGKEYKGLNAYFFIDDLLG